MTAVKARPFIDVSAPRQWPSRRRSRVSYENSSFAFLLNAPALLAIVLLVGYPIAHSAWISLHKYSLKRPRVFEFIGLENYLTIFQSEEFWSALWITIAFTSLVVTLVVALGVLIALLLNEDFPGCGFIRTL